MTAGALLGESLKQLAWPSQKVLAGSKLNVAAKSPFSTTEQVTPFNDVTHYNNFYEFGTGKEDPAKYATNFRTSPWSVKVFGLVDKPRTFTVEELQQLAPLEERIYRHRCVEAWSIVVPWIGYSLSALLKEVSPQPKAKFVAFESYYSPSQMPLGSRAGIQLPYVEGLRLDEAMHPLALLCFGMYGETLPNQDGAPVRLVLPWKYGFKSIKSLVKIKLVEKQPATTWNMSNASRIRILFQRQSPRGSSALEPGQGAPPGRVLPTPHADVQWLRSGGVPVHGDGFEKVFLGRAERRSALGRAPLAPT